MRQFTAQRTRLPRLAADRFVPIVLCTSEKHVQVGGRVADLSKRGVRMVASVHCPNNLQADDVGVLVFARSDPNRQLDLDGLRIQVRLVNVRHFGTTQVIRLTFLDPIPQRLRRWLKQLSSQQIATDDVDDMPDYDPDVWAGWAAVPSPG